MEGRDVSRPDAVTLESLAAYEQFRAQMFARGEFQNNQEEEEMILSGRQEFYTIEAEF